MGRHKLVSGDGDELLVVDLGVGHAEGQHPQHGHQDQGFLNRQSCAVGITDDPHSETSG